VSKSFFARNGNNRQTTVMRLSSSKSHFPCHFKSVYTFRPTDSWTNSFERNVFLGTCCLSTVGYNQASRRSNKTPRLYSDRMCFEPVHYHQLLRVIWCFFASPADHRRQGLAVSIGHNRVGFAWRPREKNQVSETSCLERSQDDG
jgi:hypothetical protein